MRNVKTLGSVALLALAVGMGMLSTMNKATGQAAMPGMAMPAPAAVTRAVAVITPTKGNKVTGTIWLDATPAGVHIHGTIIGMEPKSVHGFHIHEFGDMTSEDAMAAGGHYNPDHHPHGGPGPGLHNAGDLGNVSADETGKGNFDLVVPDISLDGKNPVIGRSLVIHALEDILTPTANPGARLGMGVIGIAKAP